jgi:hypothetical protein
MNYYRTLNDAPTLPTGSTEIWFVKPEYFSRFIFGVKAAPPSLLPVSLTALAVTHIHLGSVAECDLEAIFQAMQGEAWSPSGEARELILSKGLQHTSMSVGDVIVRDGVCWMVDMFGFAKIGVMA